MKHKNADKKCAIEVDIPTPIIPKSNFITIIKSRKILKMQDIIEKISGVFESPNALKTDDIVPKKDEGINPTEIVLRYVTA